MKFINKYDFFLHIIVKSIFIALVVFGLLCLVRGHAALQDDIYSVTFSAKLNADQREYFVNEINFHERRGKEFLAKAEKTCIFYPTLTDQEKARHCFTSAMAMAAPGTPWSKIIGAILVGLTNYGLDVIDASEITEEYLLKAEYHFEMKEFFEGVLING